VVAAGAARVALRSWDYETSTHVEEQAVTPALAKLNEVAEDNDEAVLSSDSMGTLQTLIKVCMFANLTARRAVRTKEAGELGASAEQVEKLSKRGIDLALAHEEACRNREKRGTTDFAQTRTTRQNQGCDLLAGKKAQLGSSNELWYYTAEQPQRVARNYLKKAGVPVLGDPFEQVGKIADRVKVAGTLWREAQKPADKRAKATRIMRLIEDGDVDSKHYEQVLAQLDGNLLAEVQ